MKVSRERYTYLQSSAQHLRKVKRRSYPFCLERSSHRPACPEPNSSNDRRNLRGEIMSTERVKVGARTRRGHLGRLLETQPILPMVLKSSTSQTRNARMSESSTCLGPALIVGHSAGVQNSVTVPYCSHCLRTALRAILQRRPTHKLQIGQLLLQLDYERHIPC